MGAFLTIERTLNLAKCETCSSHFAHRNDGLLVWEEDHGVYTNVKLICDDSRHGGDRNQCDPWRGKSYSAPRAWFIGPGSEPRVAEFNARLHTGSVNCFGRLRTALLDSEAAIIARTGERSSHAATRLGKAQSVIHRMMSTRGYVWTGGRGQAPGKWLKKD